MNCSVTRQPCKGVNLEDTEITGFSFLHEKKKENIIIWQSTGASGEARINNLNYATLVLLA